MTFVLHETLLFGSEGPENRVEKDVCLPCCLLTMSDIIS